MRRERRLYSLVARSKEGETKVIKIKEIDEQTKKEIYKEKVYLSTIDKYITTYFQNKNQLLNYLKYKNIISDNMNHIEINYHYKTTRIIQMVFQDNEDIRKIALNSTNKIYLPQNEKLFNEVYIKLINLCKNEYFRRLINDSDSLSLLLKECINKIVEMQVFDIEDEQERQKIVNCLKNELIKYRIFRTVLLIIKLYENRINRKIEEETEFETEELEEFLSEEEIMDSYGSLIKRIEDTRIVKC